MRTLSAEAGTVSILKGAGGCVETAAFSISICFWNNSGVMLVGGIGMGRCADATDGAGEGMRMGVAICVQCGCADVGER